MLSSIFPSAVDHIPSDGFFGTTCVPWDTDTHENPLVYTTQEPVLSFSGSEDSTPKSNTSNSGLEDRCPVVVGPIDERKRRRMISNRESARRSRMRKQKHLENLRNLVNRQKSENREIMKWLRFALHHGQILGQENERLRSESVMLRQKLWDLHQPITPDWQLQNELLSSSWPCNNNVTSSNMKTNRR